MKKVLIIISLLMPVLLKGQLLQLTDQYLNNTMVINPAFAGCNDGLSATLSYRDQWVGFNDAPKEFISTIHTPVFNDRVGLGAMLQRTTIGIYNTTNINANYAYRLELAQGKLAMGLGFGATIYSIDWSRLIAADPGDDLITNNQDAAFLPDFSLGVYYYTKRFFAGLSLPLFLSHELNKNSGKYEIRNNFSEYTYLLSGGYNFRFGSAFKILPSTLIKYNPRRKPQMDLNSQFIFHDKIGIGAGYRSNGSVLGMLTCQVNYQLMIVYSYDFDTGELGKFNNGSHEIIFNYIFRFKRKVTGPRSF
jgi:type IX secretion system PorP/SprF family membrane protein